MNLLTRLIRFSTLVEHVVQIEVNAPDGDQLSRRPALSMTDVSILLSLAGFSSHGILHPLSLSVSELVTLTGCPRTRVSMQLKKLRDRKLVYSMKAEHRLGHVDGRTRLSRLSAAGEAAASDVYSILNLLDSEVRSAARLGNQKHLPAKLPKLEQVLAAKV